MRSVHFNLYDKYHFRFPGSQCMAHAALQWWRTSEEGGDEFVVVHETERPLQRQAMEWKALRIDCSGGKTSAVLVHTPSGCMHGVPSGRGPVSQEERGIA